MNCTAANTAHSAEIPQNSRIASSSLVATQRSCDLYLRWHMPPCPAGHNSDPVDGFFTRVAVRYDRAGVREEKSRRFAQGCLVYLNKHIAKVDRKSIWKSRPTIKMLHLNTQRFVRQHFNTPCAPPVLCYILSSDSRTLSADTLILLSFALRLANLRMKALHKSVIALEQFFVDGIVKGQRPPNTMYCISCVQTSL